VRIWTACLLIIGDEILSGRTQDRNLATVARWLNAAGIRLAEARVVPDTMDAIGRAVNETRGAHDYVFTTGGIGPTHDDITVDAVAAALGVSVVIHPQAEAILRAYYGERLTDARLRMARVPEGAELIENARTGAPGIRMDNIFLMAGVPAIMQTMLDAIEGTLEGGLPMLSRTVGAWTAESVVADTLRGLEKDHPGVAVGSYPFWREGRTGANFVLRSDDDAKLAAAATDLLGRLTAKDIEATEGER